MSDAEASRDFPSLLDRVRAGAEVVIERDAQAVAIVCPAEVHVRRLSDFLRLAHDRASDATLDDEFSRDLDMGINRRAEPGDAGACATARAATRSPSRRGA